MKFWDNPENEDLFDKFIAAIGAIAEVTRETVERKKKCGLDESEVGLEAQFDVLINELGALLLGMHEAHFVKVLASAVVIKHTADLIATTASCVVATGKAIDFIDNQRRKADKEIVNMLKKAGADVASLFGGEDAAEMLRTKLEEEYPNAKED